MGTICGKSTSTSNDIPLSPHQSSLSIEKKQSSAGNIKIVNSTEEKSMKQQSSD
jgi:hypothetical protein